MTSNCPESSAKTCLSLLAHLRELAERLCPVAPPHCRLALLDLRRLSPLIDQPEALAFLLSPTEANIFRQFRFGKRRLEWLGGRVAAKYCLHQLLAAGTAPLPWRRYAILADIHGAPRLERAAADQRDVAISISHSQGYAAALACPAANGSCGIDIQHLTPKLAKVAERFAHADELDLIDPLLAPLTRLGLIWTAKEAVKKCLLADHASFFGSIRLTRIEHDQALSLWTARCQTAQPAVMTATVRIAGMDNHLVACATGDAYA